MGRDLDALGGLHMNDVQAVVLVQDGRKARPRVLGLLQQHEVPHREEHAARFGRSLVLENGRPGLWKGVTMSRA